MLKLLLAEVNYLTDEQIAAAVELSNNLENLTVSEYFEQLITFSGLTTENEKKAFIQGFYASCDVVSEYLKIKEFARVKKNG